jgi:hypothetical protein
MWIFPEKLFPEESQHLWTAQAGLTSDNRDLLARAGATAGRARTMILGG